MRAFALPVALLLFTLPAQAVELMQPAAVNTAIEAGKIALVDIRTPAEWAETGVAAPATPIDMTSPQFIEGLKKVIAENPGKQIALICRTGNRSSKMADALEKAGLQNVIDVAGGMAGKGGNRGWVAEGLPVKKL